MLITLIVNKLKLIKILKHLKIKFKVYYKNLKTFRISFYLNKFFLLNL